MDAERLVPRQPSPPHWRVLSITCDCTTATAATCRTHSGGFWCHLKGGLNLNHAGKFKLAPTGHFPRVVPSGRISLTGKSLFPPLGQIWPNGEFRCFRGAAVHLPGLLRTAASGPVRFDITSNGPNLNPQLHVGLSRRFQTVPSRTPPFFSSSPPLEPEHNEVTFARNSLTTREIEAKTKTCPSIDPVSCTQEPLRVVGQSL
jgi:hypothetical protein